MHKLSEALADAIWGIVAKWDVFAKNTVGRQIVRSADSVRANIAKVAGRHDIQHNRCFVKIARGSLNETQHFLRRVFKKNLLTPGEVKKLKPVVDSLAPQLNSYLQSIGRGHAGE